MHLLSISKHIVKNMLNAHLKCPFLPIRVAEIEHFKPVETGVLWN